MMLFDTDILNSIAVSEIGITPYNSEHVGPASIDVTLMDTFKIPRWLGHGATIRPYVIHPGQMANAWETYQHDDYIQLKPGAFVLGSTREYLMLTRHFCAELTGRSSWARWGIDVHATAGFIDPGFEGRITLEIYNKSPWIVEIPVGCRIAQLKFFKGISPSQNPYRGKYQGQVAPTTSRLYLENPND